MKMDIFRKDLLLAIKVETIKRYATGFSNVLTYKFIYEI